MLSGMLSYACHIQQGSLCDIMQFPCLEEMRHRLCDQIRIALLSDVLCWTPLVSPQHETQVTCAISTKETAKHGRVMVADK